MRRTDQLIAMYPKVTCIQKIMVAAPQHEFEYIACTHLLEDVAKAYKLPPATRALVSEYFAEPSKKKAEDLLRCSPETLSFVEHEFGYLELVKVMKKIVADPGISAAYVRRLINFKPRCVGDSAVDFINQYGSDKAKKYASKVESAETE